MDRPLKDLTGICMILECLQRMKFYQRSGYGDSKDYFEGGMQILQWMGLGEGSK